MQKTLHQSKSLILPLGLSVAVKAESAPPFWYRDSLQLSLLLHGAWDEVSTEWVEKLIDAITSGDLAKVKKLLKQGKSLGDDMLETLGTKPEAVIANMLRKAESYWKVHASEFGVKRFEGFLSKYRDKVASLQNRQLKAFAKSFPDRILHPEIERQLEYLQTVKIPDVMTIAGIAERLAEFSKAESYWQNMTDVQVSRLWHAQGLRYAKQNGILTGRITGPLDKLTCPVCAHLLGTRVDIESAIERCEADQWIDDPDEYVKAWKFPRLEDVDNMSREAREAKGYLPPFHPHCRHSVGWLYMRKAIPPPKYEWREAA